MKASSSNLVVLSTTSIRLAIFVSLVVGACSIPQKKLVWVDLTRTGRSEYERQMDEGNCELLRQRVFNDIDSRLNDEADRTRKSDRAAPYQYAINGGAANDQANSAFSSCMKTRGWLLTE